MSGALFCLESEVWRGLFLVEQVFDDFFLIGNDDEEDVSGHDGCGDDSDVEEGGTA